MLVADCAFLFVALILCVLQCTGYTETEDDAVTISRLSDDVSREQDRRYLLYEVNFGEGFNLRRDVYMRVATFVQHLIENGSNYVLVLPPWGNLVHWKDAAVRVPWNRLFDVPSLNNFVPVIEFEDFIKINGNELSQVVYLQHYVEGWKDNKWEERYDIRDCIDINRHYQLVNGKWRGFFYSYKDLFAKNLTCLSLQGESRTLAEAVGALFNNGRSTFIDRAEVMLHDRFGSKIYWEARRSMRYASNLVGIANNFIGDHLDADFDHFNIHLPMDWRDEIDEARTAVGGQYVAAHLRRRDFLRSHSEHVPTIESAAEQVIGAARKLGLNKVFVCTDGNVAEIDQLRSILRVAGVDLFLFEGGASGLNDGEISIIDQIISSKARHFIGTHSSTFSYRIREDREIMHFPIASTFNDFCPDTQKCEQPAKWTIAYE